MLETHIRSRMHVGNPYKIKDVFINVPTGENSIKKGESRVQMSLPSSFAADLCSHCMSTAHAESIDQGWNKSSANRDSQYTVIHLFQSNSLELREHLVMFPNTTLQGQAGLSQELYRNNLTLQAGQTDLCSNGM